MDKYCDIFYNIKNYNLNYECPFHNESFMHFHLCLSNGMNRKVIPTPFWFDLEDFKINKCEDKLLNIDDYKYIPKRRSFQ